MEKKGIVTTLLRPKVIFFTSNYSPETVFGPEWDDAMHSCFLSERRGKRSDHNKKWSEDLVWTVNQTPGFQLLYTKLMTFFV